jgi:hypothetical protein
MARCRSLRGGFHVGTDHDKESANPNQRVWSHQPCLCRNAAGEPGESEGDLEGTTRCGGELSLRTSLWRRQSAAVCADEEGGVRQPGRAAQNISTNVLSTSS